MENFQIYDGKMETKSKAKGKIQFDTKKKTKEENDPLLSTVELKVKDAVPSQIYNEIVDTKKTKKGERKETVVDENSATEENNCVKGCRRENCCVTGVSEKFTDSLPDILISSESSSFLELFDCIIKCPRCGHETDTEENMGKHWLKKHGRVGSRCKSDPYPLHRCNICGFETKVKRNLPTHSCVAVKCGLCDFESQSKQLLNQHKMTSHKTNVGLVFCDICPYKSNRINNVENHKKTVHEGIKIVCQHCAKRFTQQSDFRRHLKDIHNYVFPPPQERRYPICNNCGYKTRLLSTFDKHKCDPIKCENCDFETKNEVHMRCHKISLHLKKDGMFCCDKCSFKTARHDNLKKHKENKHKH